MFDSQKLAFENFVLGYKHGVYVFTKDGCRACEDYKKEIEWINNSYLYFVEVLLEEHNINRIEDLWNLNRKKLKDIKLDDREINHITIKMQLSGIDLNHKIY